MSRQLRSTVLQLERHMHNLAGKPLFWAALCLAGALPWLVYTGVALVLNPGWSGRDFDDLWVAGRMVLDGHAANVFDIKSFQAAHMQLTHVPKTRQLFSYPPYALLISVPFATLPYPFAFVLWDSATLCLFVLAARPFLSERLPWWVAAFAPASVICLSYGQYGLLTSALFLVAWRGSGWAAAVLTFKPHMGFLAAVRLLRLPKAFLCAIAGVVILTALSTALFGVESWVRFLTQIIPHQFERVAHGEPTLIGKQVTPALGYGLTGQVFFAALAILLLTRCFNVFTAATATFLIAPYGFHYDMPAATLGFAYLLSDPEARAWRRVACAVAFCTPALAANSALIAPPVLLLGLFAQTEEWRVRADLPSSMQRHTDLALADLALGFRQRVFRRAFF